MNPRELTTNINILRAATRRDAAGQVVATSRSVRHGPLAAKFEELSVGENRRGDQTEATVDAKFTIRFLADVEPNDQIELIADGRIWELIGSRDLDGRRRWTELNCARVATPASGGGAD